MDVEENSLYNGFDIYAESPHVMFRMAREFYLIASISFSHLNSNKLFERGEVLTIKPIYYNLAMAIELAIKTVVLLNQNSLNGYLGHDILGLLEKIKKSSWLDIVLNEYDLEIIELLSYYNMTKNEFEKNKEYDPRWKNISGSLRYGKTGVFKLPCYFKTCDLVLKLFSKIIEIYNEKLIVSIHDDFAKVIIKDTENLAKRSEYINAPEAEFLTYEGWINLKNSLEKLK